MNAPSAAWTCRRTAAACWLAAALTTMGGAALAQNAGLCGSLANGYGPYDYRTQRAELKVVEDFHFTPNIEALLGSKSGRIGGDLDYTLRASPNHHRALLATSRLAERQKVTQVQFMTYSVDCFFERALRFQPTDMTARLLFAQHLMRSNRNAEAVGHLDHVIQRSPDNGFTQYNVGLLFMDMKDPERALQQAHRAQALGFARPELKQRLVDAGKWRDADPAALAAMAALAAASAPTSASASAPASASAAPSASASAPASAASVAR